MQNKKYKHKITGDIVELVCKNKYYTCGTLYSLPVNIVENSNDWEEVKEVKLEVPIGTKFQYYQNKDNIYTITSVKDNIVQIIWDFDSTTYSVIDVNRYFIDGTWTIYKEPLFLDELGNEVFEGDKVFGVLPKGSWETCFGINGILADNLCDIEGKRNSPDSPWKYFKNKIDAENYINENKPIFSRKQIKKLTEELRKHHSAYWSIIIDNYK